MSAIRLKFNSNSARLDYKMEPASSNAEVSRKVPEAFKTAPHLYAKSIINPSYADRTKNHIYVKDSTDVKRCVAFLIDLLFNRQYPFVQLSAVNQNMDKAVFVAELLKRKVKGLHQVSALDSLRYDELYSPLDPAGGLAPFLVNKNVTMLNVSLYRGAPKDPGNPALDFRKLPGYQDPLQIALVSTRDPREYIRFVMNARPGKRGGQPRAVRKRLEDEQPPKAVYRGRPKPAGPGRAPPPRGLADKNPGPKHRNFPKKEKFAGPGKGGHQPKRGNDFEKEYQRPREELIEYQPKKPVPEQNFSEQKYSKKGNLRRKNSPEYVQKTEKKEEEKTELNPHKYQPNQKVYKLSDNQN